MSLNLWLLVNYIKETASEAKRRHSHMHYQRFNTQHDNLNTICTLLIMSHQLYLLLC